MVHVFAVNTVVKFEGRNAFSDDIFWPNRNTVKKIQRLLLAKQDSKQTYPTTQPPTPELQEEVRRLFLVFIYLLHSFTHVCSFCSSTW